jgi:hypothetical protein
LGSPEVVEHSQHLGVFQIDRTSAHFGGVACDPPELILVDRLAAQEAQASEFPVSVRQAFQCMSHNGIEGGGWWLRLNGF